MRLHCSQLHQILQKLFVWAHNHDNNLGQRSQRQNAVSKSRRISDGLMLLSVIYICDIVRQRNKTDPHFTYDIYVSQLVLIFHQLIQSSI